MTAFGEVFADRTHVLVKGWRDGGTIDAVYGPYSKARCEWLAEEIAGADGASVNNWTVIELRDFREPEPQPVLRGSE